MFCNAIYIGINFIFIRIYVCLTNIVMPVVSEVNQLINPIIQSLFLIYVVDQLLCLCYSQPHIIELNIALHLTLILLNKIGHLGLSFN